MRLPTELKECPECGKRMIAAWTGCWYATFPAQRRWIWWCACGHRDVGGSIAEEDNQQDAEDMARWRAANPEA